MLRPAAVKLVKVTLVVAVLFVALLATVVEAQSIAELSHEPATFDQQSVSVVGKVANVVTRYGDTPYTRAIALKPEPFRAVTRGRVLGWRLAEAKRLLC